MNRQLTGEHQLRLVDLRVLDIIAQSADGSVRRGDLSDAFVMAPSRVTQHILRPLAGA
jgi:hypothetical protein